MRTIPQDTAYKQLVTFHGTLRWISKYGCLTVRKTAGRFVVTLDDYDNQKVTKASYATLKGALIAAETLREYAL